LGAVEALSVQRAGFGRVGECRLVPRQFLESPSHHLPTTVSSDSRHLMIDVCERWTYTAHGRCAPVTDQPCNVTSFGVCCALNVIAPAGLSCLVRTRESWKTCLAAGLVASARSPPRARWLCDHDRMGEVAALERRVYAMADVDLYLGLPTGTSRRWIDGYERGRHYYPPVIRSERSGQESVTWGEFVETSLLARYRSRGVSLQRLRPAVQRLHPARRGTPRPRPQPITDSGRLDHL
jgi:hypothetical protein